MRLPLSPNEKARHDHLHLVESGMSPAETDIPADIHEKYEVHETRHAAAILVHDLHEEWNDIQSVLREFVLKRSDIVAPGGGKTKISQALDRKLRDRGWKERHFQIRYVIDDDVRESKTHKIDCFKGRVALEIEWNNKDPFFSRDLDNFRLLFDIGVISIGVIITRCDELQPIFDGLGREYGAKYGPSTTHIAKLLPRLRSGGGGGCPVLIFGIRQALYDANR